MFHNIPEIAFRYALGVLIITYGLITINLLKNYSKTKKVARKKVFSENVFMFLDWWGVVAIPWMYILFNFFKSYNFYLPHTIRIIGISLYTIGLLLFYYSYKILGKNWSMTLEVDSNQKLCKTGPYKYVRHPMYSSFFLIMFAQLLISANLIVGGVGILFWTMLFLNRIHAEEKMMFELFGKKYIEYISTTGVIFPKLSLAHKK